MPHGEGTAALPGFLNLLSRNPSPDAVAAALGRGPLRSYGPVFTGIASTRDGLIDFIGMDGSSTDFRARYRAFPLEYDWPASRAATHNEIVDIALTDVFDAYPTLIVDRALWEPLFAHVNGDGGRLIAVPIAFHDTITGVFGLIAMRSEPIDLSDATLLMGTAGALALWLRSLNTPTLVHMGNGHHTSEIPLLLNERQQRILLLVHEGKSNSAIARLLGYSVSTVKLDLNRAMRMLRVTDRQAAAQRARDLDLLATENPVSTAY